MALFELGQVVTTHAALQICKQHSIDPILLVCRHRAGDWGTLDSTDVAANVHAVQHDLRILSTYCVGHEKVWVITEADRSTTCVLLSHEY